MSLEQAKSSLKAYSDLVNKCNAEIKPWKQNYDGYRQKRKRVLDSSKNINYRELSQRKKELKQKIALTKAEFARLDSELREKTEAIHREMVRIGNRRPSLLNERKILNAYLNELAKMKVDLSRMYKQLKSESQGLNNKTPDGGLIARRDDSLDKAKAIDAFFDELEKDKLKFHEEEDLAKVKDYLQRESEELQQLLAAFAQ